MLNKRKIFLIISGILAIIIIASYALLPKVLISFRDNVVEELRPLLNAQLSVADLEIVGINKISLKQLIISKDDKEIIILPKTTVTVAFSQLFSENKLKMIEKIEITDSVLNLTVDEQEQWNIRDLIKPSTPSANKIAALVIFNNGTINLTLPEKKLEIAINGSVDARLSNKYALDLNLNIREIGKIKIAGLLDEQGKGKLEINSGEISVKTLEKIIGKYLSVQGANGSLKNISLIYENNGQEKLLSGKLEAQALSARTTLDNNELNFSFQGPLKIKDNILRFVDTKLTVEQAQAQLDGEIYLDNGVKFKALTVQAKDVSIDELLKQYSVLGKVSGKVQLDGSLDNLAARGEFQSLALVYEGERYTNLKVPFSLQQNQLFLEAAELEYLAGKIKISADYNLLDNKINLLAKAENIALQELPNAKGLEGRVNLDIVAAGLLSLEKIDLTGNLKLGAFKYQGLSITEASLDFLKNNESLNFYNAQALVAETGKVTLVGGIEHNNMDLYLKAQGLPLNEIGHYFGVEAEGAVNVTANIYGPLKNPATKVKLNADKILLAGQNIDNLTAEGEYQAGKINIAQLEVLTSKIMNLPQGRHQATGVIDFGQAVPVVDLEINSSGARIDELAIKFLPIKVTGFFDNKMHIAGPINNPQFAGKFQLYEGSAQGFLLDKVQATYRYQERELLLTDTEISSLQATFYINGKLTNDGKLNFALHAQKINLSRLPINKEYTPEGYADFAGALTGTINQPVFTGSVQAARIKILNQEFTDFAGNLKSEIGLKAEVDVNFKQGDARFDFYGGGDLSQAYIYGKLAVEKAEVSTLLALAKEDLETTGLLTGEINLNRRGKGTGLEIVGEIQAGSIKKIPLQNIQLNILVDKKKIIVNKFEALQGTAGKLVVIGNAEYAGAINLELSGKNLDAQLMTIWSKEPVDLTGNLDVMMQVNGQSKKPDISASVQIANGLMNNVAFDNCYALFNIEQLQKLNIQQLFIEKQGYKASAYGYIPLEIFKPYAERQDKSAQMDILFNLDNADLGILTTLTKQVPYATGTMVGNLRIMGDFNSPQLYGSLKTQDATVKLAVFKNPLLNLNLDVNFNGKKIKLNELSAQMGAGKINAVGDLNLLGNGVEDYQLAVNLNKIAIDSAYTSGPLTATLAVKPQPGKSRPYIQGEILLENLMVNIPAIPEFGAGQLPNVGLDIAVKIGKNLKMHNPILYDLDLEGGLKILGSMRYPNIDGTVRVTKGTINYLRTPFKVRYALLGFPLPGSLMPSINLYATSRLFRTDIFLNVHGNVDEMDLKLSSNPPLSQQELFRMLTLRTQVTNTTAVEAEDAKALLAAGLQMSVFGELESAVRETLGIDEFRLYQGELLTGTTFTGTNKKFESKKEDYESYNVLVSKYITDKVLIGYTTTLDREHYNYYMQYEVDKRINLNVGVDEARKYRYGVEYRINF